MPSGSWARVFDRAVHAAVGLLPLFYTHSTFAAKLQATVRHRFATSARVTGSHPIDLSTFTRQDALDTVRRP